MYHTNELILRVFWDFFERVENFKYLGANLTNQNSIQEEIKSRLKIGNACCHSVQNLLSSSLLSKNLKIKVYRIINLIFMYLKPSYTTQFAKSNN